MLQRPASAPAPPRRAPLARISLSLLPINGTGPTHAPRPATRRGPLRQGDQTRRWLTLQLTGLAIAGLLYTPRASASCVAIDAELDTLTPAEQLAAARLFEEAMRSAGLQVEPAPCEDLYELVHLRIEDRFFTIARHGETRVQDQHERVGSLPSVYRGLVDRLAPPPIPPVPARSAPTASSGALDASFSAGVGYATLITDTIAPGFNLHADLRVQHAGLMLGLATGYAYTPANNSVTAWQWSVLRFDAGYLLDPAASSSLYLGAGAALGITRFTDADDTTLEHAGAGVHFEPRLGWRFRCAACDDLAFNLEARVVLPLYTVETSTSSPSAKCSACPPARKPDEVYPLNASIGLVVEL